METKEILGKLGLTKYETEAYYYTLNIGQAEASDITKGTGIPYGKIYEVLNKLVSEGLLEVQHTRPKKYKPCNLNIAMERFLEKKKEALHDEFSQYEQLTGELLRAVDTMGGGGDTDEIFWRTAFGDEVHEFYYTSVKEAEQSLFFFAPHQQIGVQQVEEQHSHKEHHEGRHEHEPHHEEMFVSLLKEKLGQGVLTQVLYAGPQECPAFRNTFVRQVERLGKPEGITIKATKAMIITPPTLVIDGRIVLFELVDPIDSHSTLGITKIWDQQLARRLGERLEMLWNHSSNYEEVFGE